MANATVVMLNTLVQEVRFCARLGDRINPVLEDIKGEVLQLLFAVEEEGRHLLPHEAALANYARELVQPHHLALRDARREGMIP